MTGLVFRDATGLDADPIAALHAASWRRAYRGIMADAYLDGPVVTERQALWRKRLAAAPNGSDRWVRLAVDNNSVIGFACVLLARDATPERVALLDNLHVAASYHGQGIGRALLAQAAEWLLRQRPNASLELFVFTANAPARRFYERLGARLIEEYSEPEPDGSLIPALRYAWRDVTVLLNES